MTSHVLLVVFTALLFLASALVGLQIGRLLGPAYDRQRTAHWIWRFVVWAGSLVLFVRAGSLLFPGRLISVDRMSVVMTLEGVVVLAAAMWLLDLVMERRSPPPWSVKVLRLFALLGRDRDVVRVAMAVPPAAILDAPPEDEDGGRPVRLAVLCGALVAIAGVVAVTVAASLSAA